LKNKSLEWLTEEDIRKEKQIIQATIGEENYEKNYEILSKEIERRRKIEERKAERAKKKVKIHGIDEEGKVDVKEKLKQEIDTALKTKKATHKPHGMMKIKSSMK
jgi:ribosomal protein S18